MLEIGKYERGHGGQNHRSCDDGTGAIVSSAAVIGAVHRSFSSQYYKIVQWIRGWEEKSLWCKDRGIHSFTAYLL